MFEKLIIRNFQTHKALIIEFDPMITTIIGSSNKGKSAVLRALRWLCLNKRPKDEFVRWGSSFAKVTLEVDGHQVTRKQGKKNSYLLDGKVFSAVRTTVPEEIGDLLNVSDINFQRQHEAPFWFALSSGELNKEINNIVDLSIIDRSIAKISSDLRKANTEYEIIETRIKTAREQKKLLSWVKEADIQLSKIECKSRIVNRLQKEHEELRVLIMWVQQCRDGVRNLEEQRSKAQEIALKATDLLEQEDKLNQLQEIIDDMELASEFKKLQIPKTGDVESLTNEITRLTNLVKRIEEQEQHLCHLNQTKRRVSSRLKKLEGKKCPVCGQRISSLRF